VGDTPFDVLAAKEADAVPIGVVTGVFSREELLEAVADIVILQDFSDIESSLRVFGL